MDVAFVLLLELLPQAVLHIKFGIHCVLDDAGICPDKGKREGVAAWCIQLGRLAAGSAHRLPDI